MGFISAIITHIAPIFIVSSPITSYADQIYSIHSSRSSAGFSLDIPLIMLAASILKVFYWLGARYDTSLFLQALLMIVMQTVLLHVALTHRPGLSSAHLTPFASSDPTSAHHAPYPRPFKFWQWRQHQPYWTFLGGLFVTLLFLQLLLGPTYLYESYYNLLGTVALTIEATLPLPQILANQRRKSCKGFRFSVLINWLIGDAFKLVFFFLKGEDSVPWAFKLCGLFQATCDAYLGIQYAMWGNGPAEANGILTPGREVEMELR
ncbi:hypothetical protein K402DRAFT_459893 [Aulographum hederae CBS 113979]|uniref:PQ loop repeat protein n=1 Tax=Aulographum hederae CBS 113979 TaxID=1176131 RepID=A0A6G1HD70_9PEZI|nr:hypothetical protein K402DRAFT_459893 [Aulographum hederae CBS 113979]